jgi:double-stranded uracil-DNA glycosylase
MIDRWSNLRLRDRIKPGVRVLFVGINPGVRSAITGHHFAGYSNRFWKLLWESRLVPEPLTHLDDDRLHQWGFGITNLVSRPSPGIDDLRPAEYVAGWSALERKIRKYRPEIVAFVGVTLYRAILPLLDPAPRTRAASTSIGFRPETIHGARIFVLPNPSGRNAHFSYVELLAAFKKLKRAVPRSGSERRSL